MPSAISVEIDAQRWATAVPLLTLDQVRPFFPWLGLNATDPEQLQRVLRCQMIQARHDFAHSGFKAPAPASVTATRILDALSVKDRAYLALWIGRVFHCDPGDAGPLRQWTTLLRHCRQRPELWKALFGSGQRSGEVLAELKRAINIDDFELRYEHSVNSRLSDWDLHLYAVHFYDDDDSEGAPNGPHLWLAPTVRDFQGYRFWYKLGTSFDRAELAQIHARAQAVAAEAGLFLNSSMSDPALLVDFL